jgi:ankyrin repeat protein
MKMRVGSLAGLWLLPLLAVASLAGAGNDDIALVEAAEAGNARAVDTLLVQGVDANASAPDGTTALHWAVHNDDLEMANAIIRAGANANAANRYGATPLLLACTNGNASIVRTLLEAGANPHTFAAGETALMTAARTGSVDAVRVLLDAGADPHIQEALRGQTALMAAAAEQHDTVVRMLLEHGAEVHVRSTGGFTALLFAVRGGDVQSVRAVLEADADVDDTLRDGTSALMLAIVNGYYDLAAFLLDAGADPNAIAAGRTALHILVQTHNWDGNDKASVTERGDIGYLGLMQELMSHGANPNAGMTKNREVQFAEGATASGQSFVVNATGATPFWWAARAADLPGMNLLLDNGADPFLATIEKVTPLAMAAGVGYLDAQTPGSERDALEAVRLILALGADVNAASECDPKDVRDDRRTLEDDLRGRSRCCGWTALHGAASRGADSIIELLVQQGARLDATDAFERTPLNIAEGHVLYISVYIRESSQRLLRKLIREQEDASQVAARP